jgi:hypothetical protein
MTFTNTLSTDTGKVRLYIGDDVSGTGVLPDGSNFSDEQIAIFLSDNGSNINSAVAALADNLAYRWAIVPESISKDGLSVSRGDMIAKYQALAKKFTGLARGGMRSVALDRQDAYSVAANRSGDELDRDTGNEYTGSEYS